MSQTVNLIVANNVGCGMPESKCFARSGVSRRTTALYSCPSIGRSRIHSHVKIVGPKSGSLAASFVCKAQRNPDFSRQNNRHGPSRGRNKNNDARDIFDDFEEDTLSSKNGPLVSLSSGKFQATSSPGPREKEIVELFRKVQARLRERASAKEEKKVEAPREHVKEKSAVDSLLNLLKKHSAEQVKRSGKEDNGKYLNNSDQLQESNQYDGEQSTILFDSNNVPKDESREANIAFAARPRSFFQRKSPIPRIKYQPVSNNEDDTNVVPIVSDENNGIIRDEIVLKHEDKPEPEPEFEIDLDTKDELSFPELLEDDSHESEQTYNDESVEEQLVVQNEDLSALKLSELRALAKSRGLKGFSKMKKVELMELLTES
ncbi:rho-N domain-containing protein 1, chloroplastic [Cicer arietinum]|uniref:Rho-N domain-containing protein 1, chloroplastic n=1 Tax=Cicer arietinum TaxID=3827 RepID=A0A1S2XVA5_CICAR|nr:rho-N domain-containing protein 1, chloroplastic [Cicer arietinum]